MAHWLPKFPTRQSPRSDSDGEDMALVPTRMLHDLGVPVPRRRAMNAARYHNSAEARSEEEVTHQSLIDALQHSYAVYGPHPQLYANRAMPLSVSSRHVSGGRRQQRRDDAEHKRDQAAEAETAAAQAMLKKDYEKTMDVEHRARATVQSLNPEVRRVHGEQVEARCLLVGRVLVEFFMHRYLSEILKQSSLAPGATAASASTVAPVHLSLSAKAESLSLHAKTFVFNARATYKPWKTVVPDALYKIIKAKLLDASFTEWMAISILRYYLEDHPSEKDMCVIFICALRLPKGVDNHWRTKLLGDTVPFLLQSDFSETAKLLAARILVATQSDAAPLEKALLSPPADSTDEEEEAANREEQTTAKNPVSEQKVSSKINEYATSAVQNQPNHEYLRRRLRVNLPRLNARHSHCDCCQ